MATVMKSQNAPLGGVYKSAIQKVCIGMGVAFIVIGLMGVIAPGLLGMHLSMAHNLIHILSGALALWAGYTGLSQRAYNFCLSFGAVYGLLGIVGFLVGGPGYPAVGHMEADQNLFRVIPNVLELGTADHVVHIVLSAIFLFTAYAHRKDKDFINEGTRNRSTVRNVRDVNSRSTLGSSNSNQRGI